MPQTEFTSKKIDHGGFFFFLFLQKAQYAGVLVGQLGKIFIGHGVWNLDGGHLSDYHNQHAEGVKQESWEH